MGVSSMGQDEGGGTTGSTIREEESPLFEETTSGDETYSNMANWYIVATVAFMVLWGVPMVAGIVLFPMPLLYKVGSLFVVAVVGAVMLATVARSIDF